MAGTQIKKNSIESRNAFPVVGIAASAGGLDSFRAFVKAIPPDSGMAYIFMQHLDPLYETALKDILQREASLMVLDMPEEVIITANHIYIMPTDKLLVADNGNLLMQTRSPLTTHPLYSIDIFFTAISEVYQEYSVAVLLSGMGSDGSLGLKKVKDNSGVTFAQQPSSAKYPDMPQHAIDDGVVDFIMNVSDMPAQLLKVNQALNSLPILDEGPAYQTAEESYYAEIISILRRRREVDFTHYKQTTIKRRIIRRMLVNRIDEMPDYVSFLDLNVSEQDLLYQDLLIPVTAFFRDSAIFKDLCNSVFPEIFKEKIGTAPVRIWVAGCSTGEEAYSIAICIHEFLGDRMAGIKLQLFATDVSEKAIQKARAGIYTKRELDGVSEERLRQYFIKTDGHYTIKKNIRDLCIFAAHNFLNDPPFARMDLITCRNVMIYMENYLQKKAFSTFHYALNEKGYLLLGKSESASGAAELFKVVSKKEKLYAPKLLPGRVVKFSPEAIEKSSREPVKAIQTQHRKEDFHANADEIILAKYTPAGVIVNEHFEIVQFRGSTGAFLEAAPGKASLNILKMAREGLSFEIRNALHKAKENKETVVKKDILIQQGSKLVTLEVVPLHQTLEPHYLILFREEAIIGIETLQLNLQQSESKMVKQLEKDLLHLREDMRTITEEQEAANEELQSANEELLSGSEELQSLNEELETSKEELQSTNEELMTVNQELHERNEQYNRERLYSEAIVTTIREPLLVLNRDLRIQSANQSFYDFFKLSETGITGKILFELHDSRWNIAELRTQLLRVQTMEVNQVEWDVNFTLPNLGKRILFLSARTVNPQEVEQLILLAFEDVTLRRTEESSLREQLTIMETFFLRAPALFCVLRGPNHVFQFANPRYKDVSGSSNNELKGKTFAETFPELNNEGYKFILDKVYQTGEPFFGKEMKATHYPGQTGIKNAYIDLSVQAYRNAKQEIEGLLFFSYEVTEKVMARRGVEKDALDLESLVKERTVLLQESNYSLEQSNRNLQAFASIASHDLQEPLRKIKTFSGLLMDRYKNKLPLEAINLLGKTDAAARRMSTLISGVLNYSRITQPEQSFVQTDLGEILTNVMGDFDLAIAEKSVKINVIHQLPSIDAVPSQMNQLFYNILGNALKFIDPTRQPEIVISCKELSLAEVKAIPRLSSGNAYYEIVFKDNGIGFESQFAEQIFAVFERLNTLNEFEGTGIGLALCRKIADNHHGLIWGEGEENKGASIFIVLPKVQTGTTIAATTL